MNYKRLTRRNADGTTWVKCAVCDIQDKCDFTKESCCQELQDRLAELEDKIEQGTFIELPCKVGDMLYIPWVWNGTNGIAIIYVRYIFINETGVFFDGDMETDDYGFLDEYGGQYHIEEIGKKLFLTREEAEKRLKELQEWKQF